MNIDRLKSALVRHEGEVNHAYQDSEGYWTIGVGRLIDKRQGGHISHDEAMLLLENDIERSVKDLFDHHPEVNQLDDVRQEVLVNMAFNLGITRLNRFQRMWTAIRNDDFQKAADEMLDSKWARQVGRRSTELSVAMRHGEFT